jgi:hypothetical protein
MTNEEALVGSKNYANALQEIIKSTTAKAIVDKL